MFLPPSSENCRVFFFLPILPIVGGPWLRLWVEGVVPWLGAIAGIAGWHGGVA